MDAPKPIARKLTAQEHALYEMGYKEGLMKAAEMAHDDANLHKTLQPEIDIHTSLHLLGLKFWTMAKTKRDPYTYRKSKCIHVGSLVLTILMIVVATWCRR